MAFSSVHCRQVHTGSAIDPPDPLSGTLAPQARQQRWSEWLWRVPDKKQLNL
jgi:hypothetical protein